MPHIAVSLYPGRDDETKQDIAQQVERHFATTFGFGDDEVSVSVVEIPAEDFIDTIRDRYRADELYVPSRYLPRTDED